MLRLTLSMCMASTRRARSTSPLVTASMISRCSSCDSAKAARDAAHVEHMGAPAQFARHLGEQTIAACLADEPMDHLVDFPLLERRSCARFPGTRARRRGLPGRARDRHGRPPASPPRPSRNFAHVENVDEFVDRELADRRQPIEAARHQTFEFQSAQRLAHGRPGDFQRIGKAAFLKHGSRRQIAGEHHVEQPLIGLIAQAFWSLIDDRRMRLPKSSDGGHFQDSYA